MHLPAPRPALALVLLLAGVSACASPKSEAPANDYARPASAPAGSAAGPADEAVGSPDAAAPEAEPTPEPERKEAPNAAPGANRPAEQTGVAGLEVSVPMINGGLNRDIIRRIASDSTADIRECQQLASPGAALLGKLVIDVELDGEGNVDKVEVVPDGTLSNRQLEDCVTKRVATWTFDDAGGKGSAQLAFDFLE